MNPHHTKYKQTELGLIPEDWDIDLFENIADKANKWSITGGPFGSNLKVSDYTYNGVQIIQLQNIGDGQFIDKYQVFTSEEKANELQSCNIYPNEIILAKMGDPVARACFIPSKASRYLMASDGIRLVVNEKEFSKKFVHDYINSIYFRIRAFEISTGSTRLRIGLPNLKRLLVIKPPLSEQTAIATALSDADVLISSLEKLIAKKRLIKQGAMQELLSPKEGWEVKRLGEIAEVKSGKRLPLGKSLVENETPYPYIRILDMFEGGISLTDIKYIPEDVFPFIKNYRIFKDDIYISVAGTLGLVGRIPNSLDGANLTENANKLTNIKCNIDYLLFVLKSNLIQNKIDAERTMGAQPKLALTRIRNFEIHLPPLETQTHIATILSDMDAEIAALEAKLSKYQQVKAGMMQSLLTGKIRLVD